MQRKCLSLITFVVMATLVLAACGSAPQVSSEPTARTSQQEPAARKVVVTWWHISTAEDHKALWQKFADEYMATHPNVEIQITVLENEAFKSKMTTVMQSGTPPDIFQSWGGGTMIEYARAGLLKDITADLDADGSSWRSTFSPGALGVYSYQGRNYGVPWDMGMVGFWYNKDLFAQAGIDKPPTTWSEFLEAVRKLKAAGITPIALGAGDKWPAMFYYAYLAVRIGGQEAFDRAYSRQSSFAAEPFIEAGRRLQELIALQPFQDGFLGATYGDQATLIGNGKAAMELMGQWAPSVQKDNSPDKQGIGDNLGWFPFPMVEGGAGDPNDAFGGGNGFVIGKNAPPEAIDFVKYLTSVDRQIQLAENNVALPVVKGAESGIKDPLLKMVQQGVAGAKYFQLYYDQALPPAVGSVVNDSVQALFAGIMTPQELAQAIEDSFAQETK